MAAFILSLRKKEMSRKNIDMLHGNLLKNIIAYTLPIIATSFLQLLFNAADLVVVGRFGSENSVGAVGATGAITALLTNLFIGLSVGAGVAVAYNLGARNATGVYRAVHTSILVAVICGALVTAIGLAFTDPCLSLMGTPESVIELSSLYMRICFLGMIPNMVFNFAAAILRASGNTRTPLTILTIAGVMNFLLNLLLVIAFSLDVGAWQSQRLYRRLFQPWR